MGQDWSFLDSFTPRQLIERWEKLHQGNWIGKGPKRVRDLTDEEEIEAVLARLADPVDDQGMDSTPLRFARPYYNLDVREWEAIDALTARFKRALLRTKPPPVGGAVQAEPLVESHRKVYRAIRDSDGPIQLKTIRRETGESAANIKDHIIPILKREWGVKHKDRAGYYLEK
jgi:hypothetical protein